MAETYVTAIRTVDGDKQIDYEALANKPISNGVATELIALYGDPIDSMHAVTKKYCDSHYDSINQEINIINTIKIPDIYDKITEMYNRIAALEEKVEELSSSSGGGDTSGDDNTSGDSTLWYKYNFAIETKQVPYTYYEEDRTHAGGGEGLDSVSGYTSYSFNPGDGTFTLTGNSVTLGDVQVVYTGGGNSITEYTAMGSGPNDGSYTGEYVMYTITAVEQTGSDEETTYTVGSLVGTVYAEEGAYPDADSGYTYFMDYADNGAEYVIMQNGSTYYAYTSSEVDIQPESTEIKWLKYNANAIEDGEYVESAITGVQNVEYAGDNNYFLHTGYDFSSASGYSGTGDITLNGASVSGYYEVTDTMVVKVGDLVGEPNNNGHVTTYTYSATMEARATYVPHTTYSKGTTSYGEISAENGAVPEGGTLIEGSVTGSYCIATVNGTNYYYEKVTS